MRFCKAMIYFLCPVNKTPPGMRVGHILVPTLYFSKIKSTLCDITKGTDTTPRLFCWPLPFRPLLFCPLAKVRACVHPNDGGGDTGENSATFKICYESHSSSRVCKMIQMFPGRACGPADVSGVGLQALSAALEARKAPVRSTELPFSSAAPNPGVRADPKVSANHFNSTP